MKLISKSECTVLLVRPQFISKNLPILLPSSLTDDGVRLLLVFSYRRNTEVNKFTHPFQWSPQSTEVVMSTIVIILGF